MCEFPYKKEGNSVHVALFLLATHFKAEHVMTLQKYTNTTGQDSHYPNWDSQTQLRWKYRAGLFSQNYTGRSHFPHFFKPN